MTVEQRAGGHPSFLMVVVLLAASALLLVRGPWRAMRGWGGDFAAPYVAGRRFLRGVNPYSSADFEAAWHAAGAGAGERENASGTRPIYPPSTLLLMAPLSVMKWKWALGTYELFCTVLYGALLVRLANDVGVGWNSWVRIGFVAYGLALAPIHTGLGVGNVSTLAFLLAMECLLLGRARKDVAAGIILGLCFCLKPSVGVFVLFYWLVCRRWKLARWGVGLIVMINSLAMVRMLSIPSVWWLDYRANARFLFGPSGVANFTDANGFRFDLLNLQVPFYELTHSVLWANGLAWATVTALGIVWLIGRLRRGVDAKSWAAPGVLLLLGLLPIYQRNYNAGYVLIALLWSFQHLRTTVARSILLVGMFFIIPGEALLRRLANHWAGGVGNGFFMNFVVMPQATWAVLGIALLLLYGMWHPAPAARIRLPATKSADATESAGS
jgi:hypothetical protein